MNRRITRETEMLKNARKKIGLSQQQLATLAGVHPSVSADRIWRTGYRQHQHALRSGRKEIISFCAATAKNDNENSEILLPVSSFSFSK